MRDTLGCGEAGGAQGGEEVQHVDRSHLDLGSAERRLQVAGGRPRRTGKQRVFGGLHAVGGFVGEFAAGGELVEDAADHRGGIAGAQRVAGREVGAVAGELHRIRILLARTVVEDDLVGTQQRVVGRVAFDARGVVLSVLLQRAAGGQGDLAVATEVVVVGHDQIAAGGAHFHAHTLVLLPQGVIHHRQRQDRGRRQVGKPTVADHADVGDVLQFGHAVVFDDLTPDAHGVADVGGGDTGRRAAVEDEQTLRTGRVAVAVCPFLLQPEAAHLRHHRGDHRFHPVRGVGQRRRAAGALQRGDQGDVRRGSGRSEVEHLLVAQVQVLDALVQCGRGVGGVESRFRGGMEGLQIGRERSLLAEQHVAAGDMGGDD